MDCADIRRLASVAADGELPPDDEVRLRRHAEICPACAETLLLAEREVGLITSALRGDAPARPSRRPPRALWAAAVLLILAIGATVGLERAYRKTGDRIATARAREFTASLDLPVRIESRGTPLGAFLADLGERTGMPIDLAPDALARLGAEPQVNMDLRTPVRLRSVLGLLEDFYGLSPEITGTGLVLR